LLGQIPVLCVEGDYDREPEITRVMADRLPAWKKPRRVVRLAALPRTPSGKIMRRRIPPLIG
jgi:acyl-coenzyme A synthetase/AMP-(fatty) acid ligase